MYYQKNRLRAQTVNTEPTMTEQSGAAATDINLIVKSFKVTGRVPGATTAPIAGDFTGLPQDLRGMIETSRSIKAKRGNLPKALREMPIEELLTLTTDKLAAILAPPTPDKPNANTPAASV